MRTFTTKTAFKLQKVLGMEALKITRKMTKKPLKYDGTRPGQAGTREERGSTNLGG